MEFKNISLTFWRGQKAAKAYLMCLKDDGFEIIAAAFRKALV
jgi:hypothetical protein